MILKLFSIVVLVVTGLGNLWITKDVTYDIGKTIWLGYSSKKWPTVVGVIELSNVIKYPTYRGGVAYKPEISYTYQVRKVLYKSNHVEYTTFGYGFQEARELCDQFKQGNQVLIYYNSNNPKISSLTTGTKWYVYISAIIAPVWFFCSIAILCQIPYFYNTPASELKEEFIEALKERSKINKRITRKQNIWKAPDKL